jgi:hypothetical protein
MVEATKDWRPSGWLGIVVAGALWTSLSNESESESIRSLVEQIKGAVPGSDGRLSDDGDDNYEVEEPLADSGAEIRAELERLRKQIEAQAATKPTVKDATSFDPDAPAEVAAAVPELPGSFRATAEIRALKQNLLHSTAAQTKIGFWGMGGIGLRPVPVVGPFKGCDCRR